jgi:hypothetical protein
MTQMLHGTVSSVAVIARAAGISQLRMFDKGRGTVATSDHGDYV